jgi:hypothetical protein
MCWRLPQTNTNTVFNPVPPPPGLSDVRVEKKRCLLKRTIVFSLTAGKQAKLNRGHDEYYMLGHRWISIFAIIWLDLYILVWKFNFDGIVQAAYCAHHHHKRKLQWHQVNKIIVAWLFWSWANIFDFFLLLRVRPIYCNVCSSVLSIFTCNGIL